MVGVGWLGVGLRVGSRYEGTSRVDEVNVSSNSLIRNSEHNLQFCLRHNDADTASQRHRPLISIC